MAARGGRWLAGSLAVALLAIAGPAWAEPKTHVVQISGVAFKPNSLEVSPGDTVIWRNEDLVPHTVTGKGFDSKFIQPNGGWQMVVPKKKGEVPYQCTLHPTMKAKLIVK